MTGPTLSVSLATALPGKVAAPSPLALNTAGEGGPGVPGLAAFLDLMIGQQAVVAKDGEPAEDRQDDAAPGNPLPDQDDDQSDPALAWLLTVPPIAPPVADPTPIATAPGGNTPVVALPVTAQPIDLPVAVAAPAPTPVPTIPPAQPAPMPADPAVVAPQIAATTSPATPDTQAIASVGSAPGIAPDVVATDRPPSPPVRPDAPAAPAAPPIRIAVPQTLTATLATATAARITMPALFALARPVRDEAGDRDTTPLSASAAAATLLTPTDAAALIAQPGEAQRQALDMGQRDWPQKMIDRIEALRDDANANDTSIRLKPEALGRIDVSLRTHADGAVSVRFTAEQPATRSLIADAQPQLQAAAEARGIRLSGTSVDLANSGNANGDRPRPQFELQQNNTNRLAASGDEEAVSSDGRIA